MRMDISRPPICYPSYLKCWTLIDEGNICDIRIREFLRITHSSKGDNQVGKTIYIECVGQNQKEESLQIDH